MFIAKDTPCPQVPVSLGSIDGDEFSIYKETALLKGTLDNHFKTTAQQKKTFEKKRHPIAQIGVTLIELS